MKTLISYAAFPLSILALVAGLVFVSAHERSRPDEAAARRPAEYHPELRGPEWNRDGIRRDHLRETIARDFRAGR